MSKKLFYLVSYLQAGSHKKGEIKMLRHKIFDRQFSIIAIALVITMFVATESALTAQELKVGFIPGRGNDAALEDTAFELAEIEYEKIEAGDYTLERLMEFDVIGVGVTAYDGNEDLKANFNLLKVYVENGGYLVTIDFQQDSSWNQNYLPHPITLLDPDLDDDVGVILAEHNIFNTPNEITEEHFGAGIWGDGDFMADGPEAVDPPWEPLVTDRQNNWPIVVGAPAGKGYVVFSSLQILQSLGNTGNEKVVEVLQNFLFWRGPRGSNVKASNPTPRNGTLYPDTWVNLSWWPGPLALSHDLYIGDNFNDVNEGAEGTFVLNQAETFIVVGFPGFPYPEGLIPGTTYYWRIDEVNDADPNSPWKGNVWSFSIPPKTAYSPNPADGAASVALDVELTWTAGFGSKLHTVYFGDNFDEVNNAAGGLPLGVTNYNPAPLTLARTYYWRVDEFDVVETHKGQAWSFTTEGGVANPNPANGAVDITQTPILTWSPGVFADSHDIFFGLDASSLELKGSGNLGSESYDAGNLEWNTTYYWRIDEANNTNTDSPWTGPLWSFTTANFLTVDDFESYNDLDPADPASDRIFNVWLDGFDNPALNGSVVGNANAPFAEQTIVHSGTQSMPLEYDNAVGKSEATLTLTSSRDWTVNGVNTLTIWFRGESANTAENLYVALNGSAVVNHDNPDAAKITSWTEWSIDLQAFADQGVNLANVTSITLGLGNKNNPVAGGSGMMYFDDIRLYAPTP
ncbi:MAG: hypothetical protein FVQ84_15815 [Planctomycetes bacterium]|nr:hypothetical protein [Planctomycetota bacterium]